MAGNSNAISRETCRRERLRTFGMNPDGILEDQHPGRPAGIDAVGAKPMSRTRSRRQESEPP